MRSRPSWSTQRCIRSSVGTDPKYWPIAKKAPVNSSRSRTGRTSNAMTATLRDAFERGVVEHEPPLASVGEANGHDTARLDLCHHALAERAVPDRVARRE